MQNLITEFEKYNLFPAIHAPCLALMPHLQKNEGQNVKLIDAPALICYHNASFWVMHASGGLKTNKS